MNERAVFYSIFFLGVCTSFQYFFLGSFLGSEFGTSFSDSANCKRDSLAFQDSFIQTEFVSDIIVSEFKRFRTEFNILKGFICQV